MQTEEKTYITKPTNDELLTAFRAAFKAAEAVSDTEDSGTCNFDTAALFVSKRYEKRIMAIAADEGFQVWHSKWCGGCFMLNPVMYVGQAYQRTVVAEAIKNTMRAAGFDCGVYYQMD